MKQHLLLGALVLTIIPDVNWMPPPTQAPTERRWCRSYEEATPGWWRNTFRCGPDGGGDRTRPERPEKNDKPATE